VKKGKVVFCTPTLTKLMPEFISSLEASVPVIEAADWEHGMTVEQGNAYISGARATMLRKALNALADVIVFLDYDLSWPPEALLKLIETEGDVVAGTYRFKKDEEEYMGWLEIVNHAVQVRDDGALKATHVPAGFLKITRRAVNRFMDGYPELIYGERCLPHIDLFNHGAMGDRWFGEDYAFSKRWTELDGDIWLVPDLEITHHSSDAAYPGNFWRYVQGKNPTMRRLPKEN